ncbi:LacI family transcriptional regulator [Halobacillus salinarum]|uniref:LacI family transcriptional regulator n=1 Tax=Halobacillus salinarum TaxID=2932257 RepID=A0ABY4ELC7_9BACI|nr:LacI family DNA-binding transcriptional regulator [Halobacillus salinarum]UOQ42896.1 LacI family transcriptional regulator [Halobacillus salinarum]
MATISDVAKLTGLSKSTVSRVINNHPYISKEKRKLVEKAMDELGYQPNPSARRLRGQLTSTIGVVVPRIANPFFSYLLASIEQTAFQNNYQVLMFQSNENKEKEVYFLNLLKTKQVDGLIMTAVENDWNTIEPFTKYGPIILCNEYLSSASIPMIRVNQTKGAYLAAKHFIDQGHTKIAYCTGGLFADDGKDKDRNKGYQQALEEAGIPLNPSWIFINKHSIEDGKKVMKDIIELKDNPTAIFTGSDEIAAGVIIQAKELGLKVPEDIAVIGFDDQPSAEMLDPKLTTIRQPIEQMGQKAVEVLLSLLNKSEPENKMPELPVELVVRNST